MKEKSKGFSYYIDPTQIEAYGKWPLSRRLRWLLEGNRLRRTLPKETIEIQEAFRQGKI
jgi:hypothetical protein